MVGNKRKINIFDFILQNTLFIKQKKRKFYIRTSASQDSQKMPLIIPNKMNIFRAIYLIR